jgi:DNA-binding NarL/FixJ family response regulator
VAALQRRSIRVLVVDDFAPWRRITHTLLRNKPELKVVCEVSDGLEAVQKARELKPDLILLDIGLPKLSGIAAARQIRDLAPKSIILFVSENYSADIAREALSTGGRGYVIKSDAGSELLTAVEAVMHGKQFVSARLAGQLPAGVTNAQTLDGLRIREILESFAPRLPRNHRTSRCHEVQFYSEEAVLLERLSRFVGAVLDAGGVVVGFVTEHHRKMFIEGLQSNGLNVRAAIQQGTYRLLDVTDSISAFMVNDSVDPVRYLEGMADLVESGLRAARSNHPHVAVYGELAVPLLAQGNADAVLQIEQLSDQFATEYELDILCTYPVKRSRRKETGAVRQRICAEHSTVFSQ